MTDDQIKAAMSSPAFKALQSRYLAATHDWVGFCKCGIWRCVAVDMSDESAQDRKHVARFVADGIKDGLEMKRMTHEEWKALPRPEPDACKCEVGAKRRAAKKKQGDLFA